MQSRFKQIIKELCILNTDHLKIYDVLNFMFKLKDDLIPDAFQNKFHRISYDYLQKIVCTILRKLGLA